MADINYDPFNDVTDPDAAVAGINASLASLFPPTAINPFVTLGDLASIKQMNTARILGRYTAGVGAVEEITIGANLTLSPLGVLSASGGGGGGTLAATLLLGNTSGASDIIMDSGQVIKDSVLFNQLNLNYLGQAALTSTAGVGIDAAVEVDFIYTAISNAGDAGGVQQYQIGVELFNDGVFNLHNAWSTGIGSMMNMGVSPVFGASFDDYQDIVIAENSTAARTVSAIGNRRAVFIGTRNATMNAGITRSVIIGGNGITGNADDTVYVGNNLVIRTTSNATAFNFVAATSTLTIGAVPGQNGIINMSGFGVGGTPRINMTGGTGGTAGINVQSGGAGSATGYFGTYATIPGSPYRNVAFGLLCAATAFNPRMFLWQQNTIREIVLLTNASDDSTLVNVGVRVAQDTVTIQRIHNLGAPPVYTAKLNIGGSTLALSALNIQTSALIPTAPGAGDMWYDGTDMYLDNGALTATTRQKVARVLTAQAPLNFPATGTLQSSDLTITVTGATPGDHVALGTPNGSVIANSCYTAWVSGANTVTVRFNNYSTGLLDPGNGVFRVMVFKN